MGGMAALRGDRNQQGLVINRNLLMNVYFPLHYCNERKIEYVKKNNRNLMRQVLPGLSLSDLND